VLARLARAFLVVALLAGWQAALQHPLEHVDELGAFVHLHSGSHGENPEAGPLCDALAALTACAPDAIERPVAAERPEQSVPLLYAGREGAQGNPSNAG
jgi:hypothetical protein